MEVLYGIVPYEAIWCGDYIKASSTIPSTGRPAKSLQADGDDVRFRRGTSASENTMGAVTEITPFIMCIILKITSYNLLELINGYNCMGNLTVNEWWMDGEWTEFGKHVQENEGV